ncbi:MAG: IS1634 family transposase [Microbacter sp.]
MHFDLSVRRSPETKKPESYFRIKENYRDIAGVVRSRILLVPGFIPELEANERKQVAQLLTYWKENREQASIFAVEEAYEPIVIEFAHKYWHQIQEKGTLDINPIKEKKRIEKDRELVFEDSIKNRDARDLGTEWLCYQAIKQLCLEEFLHREGWSEKDIQLTVAHLITRTVYHSSEYKSLRIMQENSAACELVGLNPEELKKHNLYDVPLRLYGIKESLEKHLARTTTHLFNLTNKIVLFDLTNTYFEGRKQGSKKAQFGRSKEKRSDARLMVLALAINPEGFIKYSAILEGNATDPGSLPEMAEQLAKSTVTGNQKVLVVLDAGIATEENLKLIKGKGYDYLCVSRSKPDVKRVNEQGKSVTVTDCENHPITLTAIQTQTEDGDYWLKIKSPQKELKERSMNRQFKKRFEELLEKIEASLHKKSGIKKYDKVLMRIGRAQQNYPSIQRHYQIDIQKDEKDQVTLMQWSIKNEPLMDANTGIYFLRTSVERLDEKTTWEYYNLIREIENTFRTLKTDLDLRPIYHQRDESSEAHLFLGLLAYWLVNTIRYQLKRNGIKYNWTEITRIMSTQKVLTTTAKNKLGEQVAFRNCTMPETQVAEIYEALKYRQQPFKRRKICSTQTHPPDSIFTCLAMSSG